MGNKSSSRVIPYDEARARLGPENAAMYDHAFRRLCLRASGVVPMNVYLWDRHVMAAMLDVGMPAVLSHRLFAAFDASGEESLGLEDFVCGMAVVTKGAPREKAALLFAAYDAPQDGELHVDRLAYFLSLVFWDRPQPARDYARAAAALVEAAQGRYSDRVTKVEWVAWAVKTAAAGGWVRAPLLGWLDRLADALVPTPLLDALARKWLHQQRPAQLLLGGPSVSGGGASGCPGAGAAAVPAAATATAAAAVDQRTAGALLRAWERIRGGSASGVVDAAAVAGALGPLVPPSLVAALVAGADADRRGALRAEEWAAACGALLSGDDAAAASLLFDAGCAGSGGSGRDTAQQRLQRSSTEQLAHIFLGGGTGGSGGSSARGGGGAAGAGSGNGGPAPLLDSAGLARVLEVVLLGSRLAAATRPEPLPPLVTSLSSASSPATTVAQRSNGGGGSVAALLAVDSALGVINPGPHSLLCGSARAKANELLPGAWEELRVASAAAASAAASASASGGVSRAAFVAWVLHRRPELLAGLSLLRQALHVECGVRPPTPSAEADALAACFRHYDPAAPGRPGDAWFIVPAAWWLAWVAATGFSGGGDADRGDGAASPTPVVAPPTAPPGRVSAVATGRAARSAAHAPTAASAAAPAPLSAIPTLSILRQFAPRAPARGSGAPAGVHPPGTVLWPPVAILRSSLQLRTPATAAGPAGGQVVALPARAWAALAAWYGVAGPPVKRSVVTVVGATASLHTSGGTGVTGAGEAPSSAEPSPWAKVAAPAPAPPGNGRGKVRAAPAAIAFPRVIQHEPPAGVGSGGTELELFPLWLRLRRLHVPVAAPATSASAAAAPAQRSAAAPSPAPAPPPSGSSSSGGGGWFGSAMNLAAGVASAAAGPLGPGMIVSGGSAAPGQLPGTVTVAARGGASSAPASAPAPPPPSEGSEIVVAAAPTAPASGAPAAGPTLLPVLLHASTAPIPPQVLQQQHQLAPPVAAGGHRRRGGGGSGQAPEETEDDEDGGRSILLVSRYESTLALHGLVTAALGLKPERVRLWYEPDAAAAAAAAAAAVRSNAPRSKAHAQSLLSPKAWPYVPMPLSLSSADSTLRAGAKHPRSGAGSGGGALPLCLSDLYPDLPEGGVVVADVNASTGLESPPEWGSVVSGLAKVYAASAQARVLAEQQPPAPAPPAAGAKPSTALQTVNKRGIAVPLQPPHGALLLPGPFEAPVDVGLANLGNTCYLSSALQCLLHTPLLMRYFASGMWRYDLHPDAPLGSGGYLALAFADMARDIWEAGNGGGSSSSGVPTVTLFPRRLKYWLAKAAPRFEGNEQHDAQDALATVLSLLNEDLNRVKKKPYAELPDSKGRDDVVVAEEWWLNHVRRERSIVTALFTGQFK